MASQFVPLPDPSTPMRNAVALTLIVYTKTAQNTSTGFVRENSRRMYDDNTTGTTGGPHDAAS